VTGASAPQIGQCRLWDFFARQIDWIENRRATQAHRLVPGMKIKSSGNAGRTRRQIPLRFSHFATKGEIRRESSGGCVRFTLQEFREQRFHHRNRKLSLYRGGSTMAPRRYGTSRLGVSGKPGVRGVTP
jgi:hypothetical protein